MRLTERRFEPIRTISGQLIPFRFPFRLSRSHSTESFGISGREQYGDVIRKYSPVAAKA